MVERFEIHSGGHDIAGLLTTPEGEGRFSCVILSHGLVSSKESSKHTALSEAFRAIGIGSCRFDYHGCGESGGRIEETTLTIRIGDLKSVADWVFAHPSINPRKVGLLGSSFGGCTSLVKAARDTRIRCVSLWATPYLLENKEDGSISGIAFRDAIFEDFARYDLLAEATKVSCGLVIHGEEDEVVPADEGRAIYANLRDPKRFELIRGGDHVLTMPGHRDRAINLASDWFARFLLKG